MRGADDRMEHCTYTYATVVQNTKAVFDQVIIHCINKKERH